MARFAVNTLEFDKVKEMLAKEAGTSLGRKLALELQSSSSFEKVKLAQEETAEALRLLEEGQRLPLGGMSDITAMVKRTRVGSILEPEEFKAINDTIEGLQHLKKFLVELEDDYAALRTYGPELGDFSRLMKQLNSALDEKGDIKDNASVKLAGLRTGILVAKNRVKDKLNAILHDPNNQKYFQDALVTMREERYVIPIKQEYRLNFPGVVHDQSSTGATLFIEPMAVVNLNNDIKKYHLEEQAEVERILRNLTSHVGAEADNILSSLDVAAKVDLISAKANMAQHLHCCRPMMGTAQRVRITKGCHPLLDPQKVVPLDITLGDGFTTLLITGPNTGGKTVALKTVGLFALMAQAGLFVPAQEAVLPVFGGVYADIGDEQSIEQSLSTFSGHMKNMISILDEVREGDLVLVDEVCVGTDPTEGAALAMSMIQYLYDKHVLTIMTTHYSELKTFAYEHEGMENASVEFDPETLRPTYKLLMGVPGSSNAFYISQRLGLPQEILDRAKTFIGEGHSNMERVLQNLEGERREYESRKEEIETLRRETEYLRNELVHQKNELDKSKNAILRKAREQADELYRNARKESTAILKELRANQNIVETTKVEELAELSRKILNKNFSIDGKPVPEGQGLTSGNAAVGKHVYVKKLGQSGVIAAINGNEVTVRIGIMKMNARMKDCLLLKEENQPAKTSTHKTLRRTTSQSHNLFVKKAQDATVQIDVRGKTVDEAIPYVDKAIDDALLAGMERFRLVHGKGTGMLRKGLTEYLNQHPNVKKTEIAPQSEGGFGATIVYVK
ncbi:MAG: endonuclease MutS2 [Acidaminococcus provencensis]|jgi:DNA mismatch repair protein MutS2|uniref:endonuclease MutS2 n=1 Tax=Acidaminococcus TaxID=904 RepID=UPI000CF943FC|nr:MULTISPECIES: endonuclease MutS2 [Acidaminococcus]MCH4095843.1 endonuclease MutS2 [Acidaminococcus provencensis]RHK01978.1 endonuclease MutS2 [Acidaminococcus sp. AM05-11]